jgi:hypothetical protein
MLRDGASDWRSKSAKDQRGTELVADSPVVFYLSK